MTFQDDVNSADELMRCVNEWLSQHPDIEIVHISTDINSDDAAIIHIFYKE